jgi:hypothetical protein
MYSTRLVIGTDYLQLLDRPTAEIILVDELSAFAALVELRTKSEGPPVWQYNWNAELGKSIEFETGTNAARRL